MAFHQLPYNKRREILGDIAESIFEAWCLSQGILFEKVGQDRPRLKKHSYMPALWRDRPDYQCEIVQGSTKKTAFVEVEELESFFVEVKGCLLVRAGQPNEETFKFKLKVEESLKEYCQWLEKPVYCFVYDQKDHSVFILPLEDILTRCETADVRKFDTDNNLYYALTKDMFTWTPLTKEVRNKAAIIRDTKKRQREEMNQLYGWLGDK